MVVESKSIDVSEYEWRYTRKTLEDLYDGFTQAEEEGEPKKEDAWLAMAAGYALDLMNFAREVPNHPKELNLVGPSTPNDMSLVAVWVAMVFQDEGPDAVRARLSKMLACYEFFTTMNTLLAFEVDFNYRIDESGIIIQAIGSDGGKSEINLLGRARFAMSRSLLPEIGEEPNVGIGLGPLYNKLHRDFVIPLIQPKMDEEAECD